MRSAKFTSSIVYGNSVASLVVTLTQPAPAGGTIIRLSTGSAYLTVPATYTIPEGSSTATIPIPAGNPTKVTGALVSVSLTKLAIPATIRIFPAVG